jgi:hypothetical protein
MSNIILGYGSIIANAGTLASIDVVANTATEFVATLPLSNSRTDILAAVARTTTDAEITVTMPFTTDQTVGCIAICNHNFSANAQVDFNCKDSSNNPISGGTGTIKPRIDTTRNSILTFWLGSNVTTCRSIEITITDIGNTDTYLEFGHIFVGKQFETSVNAEYGALSHGVTDMSTNSFTKNGVKFSDIRQKLRTSTLTLAWLTETESLEVNNLKQLCGITSPIVYGLSRPTYDALVPDEKSSVFTFIGAMSELDALSATNFERYSTQFQIKELGI